MVPRHAVEDRASRREVPRREARVAKTTRCSRSSPRRRPSSPSAPRSRGEWELERTKQGAIVRARTRCAATVHARSRATTRRARGPGAPRSRCACAWTSRTTRRRLPDRARRPPPPADADEAPVPEPALKTAFSFDFAPLHGGRYLLSETPRKAGLVQFMMLGRDHFVLSQYATTDGSPAVTTWTAARAGAAAPGAAGAPPKRGGGGLGAAGRGCSCRRSSSWLRGRRSRANELRARIRPACFVAA